MIRLAPEETISAIAVCIASWMPRNSESCFSYRTVVLTRFVTSGIEQGSSIRISHWTTEIVELSFFEFLALDCNETESYLKRKIVFVSCRKVCFACRNTIAVDAGVTAGAQGTDICIVCHHWHPPHPHPFWDIYPEDDNNGWEFVRNHFQELGRVVGDSQPRDYWNYRQKIDYMWNSSQRNMHTLSNIYIYIYIYIYFLQ